MGSGRPTGRVLRIPICQIGGMVTYREIDPRAAGDDPLMCWIRGAADWEITDLRWNEKIDQPGSLTWRGDTLWDDTTDGEVHLECEMVGSGTHLNVYVCAPFRPEFTGVVTVGGIEWRAHTPRQEQPRPRVRGDIAAVLTTGYANVSVVHAVLPTELAPASDPYRVPGAPVPVAAQTVLTANCTGVIEQAFKDSIEASIRRVYKLLVAINRNRTAGRP